MRPDLVVPFEPFDGDLAELAERIEEVRIEHLLPVGSVEALGPWSELPNATRDSIFLLSLVLAASMMPVHKLPDASWRVALELGFVSAVFDNIPLTALALHQGGYDCGFLAYGVGFGGSMVWFGSSAGVALSNMYPEAKDAIVWVRGGWHVTVAYVIGFLVMLAVLGWYPQPKHESPASFPKTASSASNALSHLRARFRCVGASARSPPST